MVDVWLPYGKTEVCVRVPTRNFLGSIEPKERPGVADAKAEVERALNEPIGSGSLNEIVKAENKVAIVVDDSTRSVPSRLIIEPLLSKLNSVGVKDDSITIIFACGTHRPVSHEEAIMLLGQEIVSRIRTLSHDCRAQDLVYVGTTHKHGTKVYVNRAFVEADTKILTGDVCFHYFAGYGGGRKSVVPGVAGEETIKKNHAMLLDSNARVGVLEGNPVHEDMIEAARLAKVDFVLNIVLNSRGEMVKAFAGDLEQAFLEGVELVNEMYRVTVDRRADIVVVSAGGHPAESYDFFIAEAPLMQSVGRILGPILGPRGKMPIPVPPTADITALIDKHRKTIVVRTRSQPMVQCRIGTENMKEEELAENTQAVLRALEVKLKKGIVLRKAEAIYLHDLL